MALRQRKPLNLCFGTRVRQYLELFLRRLNQRALLRLQHHGLIAVALLDELRLEVAQICAKVVDTLALPDDPSVA
jgi:hypothetical protein